MMRPKKRLGRAMWLCHVCGVILECFFSLFLLTRHLHLNAWQQAAEERCGNKSWDCVRDDQQKEKKKRKEKKRKRKRGEGLKTEGKRKSYFGQRRFRWPDFLGRYLWREQENYCLVSPSSEISPVAYCCSPLQDFCRCLIMYFPVSGTCNWFLRDLMINAVEFRCIQMGATAAVLCVNVQHREIGN